MKLKCLLHNKRVIVFEGTTVIHRSDGSSCDAELLKEGAVLLKPDEVKDSPGIRPGYEKSGQFDT